MNLKQFFIALSLVLTSCTAPNKLTKPDFSKKIEIKKQFFPKFMQEGEIVEIGYFYEHPDLEIRKEFVTHLNYVDYINYGIVLAFSVGIYGVLDNNRDLQTGGFVAAIAPYLFAPLLRRNIIKITQKHNKKVDAKSTLILPEYNHVDGSAGVKAQIRF